MRLILLLTVLFCMACKDNKQAVEQTIVDTLTLTDTIKDNKKFWKDPLNGNIYPLPDSIGGKPVSFYIANPKIISLAKDFYKGTFRPADNDSTTQLLSHVVTDDSITRPFYRWCLDFTIVISDGALGEYPGIPSLKYAIKFPIEFFDFMDEDNSGERYKRWTEIIAYSGLNDYNKQTSEIEKEISNQMLGNCPSCGAITKNRILAFAKDIANRLQIQD
jgi:hypothetical protein